MKKIIALFVIMLAFGVNANAQQKKTKAAPAATATATPAKQQYHETPEVQKAAARDIELMSTSINLTEEQKNAYKGLFEMKHRTLSDKNLSTERKTVLASNIEMKIKSMLTPDQIAKLDSNPQLLKTLVN